MALQHLKQKYKSTPRVTPNGDNPICPSATGWSVGEFFCCTTASVSQSSSDRTSIARMALNSGVAVHSSAFAFDFIREETRERTDSPPDTIHRPIAKHQGGTPPCESSRGNLAMGLKLDAAGQQKEGFVIMGVNGM